MSQQTRILVVHGSQLTRDIYARELTARGYSVTTAASGRAALSGLTRAGETAPLAIICGLSLPDMRALSFMRRVRLLPETRTAAMLFLSAFAAGQTVSSMLSAGAQEVFSQTMAMSEMVARLVVHIRAARSLKKLSQRADRDDLTGLYNRRGVLSALHHARARQAHEGGALGLLMIDLNGFKRINDAFGHGVGDGVLQKVAGTLRRAVGDAGTVGRLGGDEFLAILPDTDEWRTAHLARALSRSIAEVHCPDVDVPIAAAVGSAVVTSETLRAGIGCDELLERAARSMYRHKRYRKLKVA